MAFPKLSRLVACMCDMSMRDVVVESPFVSLLVRPFESCLHFRLVNINNVIQTSLVLCVLRPGERNGCDSVTTYGCSISLLMTFRYSLHEWLCHQAVRCNGIACCSSL